MNHSCTENNQSMTNKNKKFDCIEFIDTPIESFRYEVSNTNFEFEPELGEKMKYTICDSDDELSSSDCDYAY